jgi:hypothetical protein
METLVGALDGMGSVSLHKVDAICAVTTSKNNVQLIGVGGATWDGRPSQHETLLNSHHLRSNKVQVNDVAKVHGGSQDIIIEIGGKTTILPLDFDNDTMKLHLREPTDEELATLGVVWLMPAMVKNNSRSIRRNRIDVDRFRLQVPGNDDTLTTAEKETAIQERSLIPKDKVVRFGNDNRLEHWKQLLGYPTNEVMEKTLESTTQLCAEPVEMERREIPRQHRKKRLLPLHPRRLRGRTDTDTFFSSVKSIHGYKCVQLFVHRASDYLFVRCMQREAHSHGAYQDFVREIGAPELIVTDNSQTQTGKKWEATSRSIITKQRKFEPHNQNQNKAERRIQDVKHRVMMVLGKAKAPLIFWCYCLIYVIDCLNFTAKKSLGWKTSYEILNGDTPDISAFRFGFWQPIDYFDPTAKFPDSQWKQGRFLGIAWDSGDQFTFTIWTEPGGDWRKGRELVRNIVRPRQIDTMDQEENLDNDYSSFKFQKKVATRKRRNGHTTTCKYLLRDLEEFTGDDDSDMIGYNTDIHHAGESQVGNHVVLDNSESDDDVSDVNSAEQNDPGGEMESLDEAAPSVSMEPSATNLNHPQSKTFTTTTNNNINVDHEMVNEINDQFSRPDEVPEVGGSIVSSIVAHEWRNGQLQFKVLWSNDETSWETLKDLRQDHPRKVAKYIVEKEVSRLKRGGDRVLQWAKKVVRDTDRAIRRIIRLYDFYLDENESIRKMRRVQKGSRKKRKVQQKPRFKYGIEVPRNVGHALELDMRNGNTYWADSIKKEVDDLIELDSFEFKEAGYDPGEGWQRTTLHMVFDVKQDLRRKSRLVAGGHLVELLNDTPVYSSTVKSISVQLLHVIAHKAQLKQLCGDIGNAFVNAYTNEKVYVSRAGKEFGEHEGKVIIIRKALYGLRSSSERFHSHVADTLRSF